MRGPKKLFTAALSLLVGAGLLVAVAELPPESAGLQGEVLRRMGESGVRHPVTAVLLTFRVYDTWLETVVLLLAVLAVLALRRSRDLRDLPNEGPASAPLTLAVRLLVPVMVLAGGHLLWLGKEAPGGAFQGGVILGAAGVLLRLSGFTTLNGLNRTALHAWLLLGPAAFLPLVFARLLLGAPMLSYPAGWAATAILVLETLITLSVAATVLLLVMAARPLPGRAGPMREGRERP